jgi:hypothetical protein
MFISPATLDSFTPGQRVDTSFGPGTVSAVSRVDSRVYVMIPGHQLSLYILRPEQLVDEAGGYRPD